MTRLPKRGQQSSGHPIQPRKTRILGIPGPRTQYDGIRRVGSPEAVGISAEEKNGELLGLYILEADPEPWELECTCGLIRIIGYERLVELVRETLARGQHHLTLP